MKKKILVILGVAAAGAIVGGILYRKFCKEEVIWEDEYDAEGDNDIEFVDVEFDDELEEDDELELELEDFPEDDLME